MLEKITYTKVEDYYIPNLIDTVSINANELGKYGRIRLRYLKEHKHAEYIILWSENKLREHLKDIDITTHKQFKLLMKQFAKKENVTEKLKDENQLEWVKLMNSIKIELRKLF